MNSGDGRQLKVEIRREMRGRLKALSGEFRRQASLRVCDRLRQQAIWQSAASILFYAARQDEPDLSLLEALARAEGRLVALPQFDAETKVYRACATEAPVSKLPMGRYGIPEPDGSCPSVPLARLDLILVPGVAFDRSGHRLGRGGGYYDRLLSAVAGVKCGVAFDEQLRAEVPIEGHDILLDYLATPALWLEFRLDRHGNDRVG